MQYSTFELQPEKAYQTPACSGTLPVVPAQPWVCCTGFTGASKDSQNLLWTSFEGQVFSAQSSARNSSNRPSSHGDRIVSVEVPTLPENKQEDRLQVRSMQVRLDYWCSSSDRTQITCCHNLQRLMASRTQLRLGFLACRGAFRSFMAVEQFICQPCPNQITKPSTGTRISKSEIQERQRQG